MAVSHRELDAAIVADESLFRVGDELDAAGGVVKELEAALDVLYCDLRGLALGGDELRGGDEVACVSEACLLANLGQQGERVCGEVDFLLGGADVDDLLEMITAIWVGVDDDDAVEEVEGQAVGALVVCTPDLGVAAIASHDDDGSKVVLQCPVHESKGFDV